MLDGLSPASRDTSSSSPLARGPPELSRTQAITADAAGVYRVMDVVVTADELNRRMPRTNLNKIEAAAFATLLRRLYLQDPLQGLLLTFGLAMVLEQGIRLVWGLSPKAFNVPPAFAGALKLGAFTYSKYRSFILVSVILLIAGLMLFLQKTPIGTIVRAGSRDPMMVRLLGISLTPVLTLVFGLGTALAAIAGVLSAPLAGVQPAMGVNVGTAAFVVVTIGGLGSFWGAIISGLLVGQVVSLSIYFQPRAAEASMYVLMAVILLLRPRGLMGERWEKFD